MTITQETHRMEANYLPTGGVILYCPVCGYRVQVNPTGPNKTLALGDAATVPHTWTLSGDVRLGVEGSKEPPSPIGGGGGIKRVQMHRAGPGCAFGT